MPTTFLVMTDPKELFLLNNISSALLPELGRPAAVPGWGRSRRGAVPRRVAAVGARDDVRLRGGSGGPAAAARRDQPRGVRAAQGGLRAALRAALRGSAVRLARRRPARR